MPEISFGASIGRMNVPKPLMLFGVPHAGPSQLACSSWSGLITQTRPPNASTVPIAYSASVSANASAGSSLEFAGMTEKMRASAGAPYIRPAAQAASSQRPTFPAFMARGYVVPRAPRTPVVRPGVRLSTRRAAPSRWTRRRWRGCPVSHATAWPSDGALEHLQATAARTSCASRRCRSRAGRARSSRSSFSRSSTGIPMTSSEAIEAEACEIAQPWPEKRTSVDLAVAVDLRAAPSARRRTAG